MRSIKYALRQSNLIEGFDSDLLLEDSLRAWEYINDLDVLTLHDIKTIHWLITQHQLATDERGTYRFDNQINVTVGGYAAPSHHQVLEMMLSWLQQATYLPAKDCHVMFEKIHPFVDGNGRTGRLIYYWQDDKAPIILDKDKQDYY